jgi:hypothetical protein
VAVSLAAVLGVRPAAGPADAAGQASTRSGSDRQKFVGTYRLVTTEVKDASGKWTQAPGFNSIGYITYGASGHMGVQIMPLNRKPFAATTQPTAEEAQQALRGYTSYFGPFTVNEKEKFVVHHRIGQINPGGQVDAKRFYDLVDNKLILTPAPANGGPKEQATNHLIWERLPDAQLSAEARKFVGFRKLLYTDSYTMKDGKMTSHGDKVTDRAGAWIIYTPTGHMMVHLPWNNGRKKYAAQQPTPEEALAAYRTYNAYFGRFTVHENEKPRYVVHNQEGTLNPGQATEAQRFYELNGNILRLGGPPNTQNGVTTGGHLYWERLPNEK